MIELYLQEIEFPLNFHTETDTTFKSSVLYMFHVHQLTKVLMIVTGGFK